MRLVALLAIMLSGCGYAGFGDTPQAQCARQANADPAVVAINRNTWIDGYRLDFALRQATLRCLQAKGLAPPGGVEPVQVN